MNEVDGARGAGAGNGGPLSAGAVSRQRGDAGRESAAALDGSRKFTLDRIRMDALTRSDLVGLFAEAIAHRSSIVVLHHNLHGIYIQRTLPDIEGIYARADWVYVDGLPLVWLARAAGLPLNATHRITLMDCFEEIIGEAARNRWRVYYLGGKQEVLTAGLTKLQNLYPGLEIAGHHGYVSAEQTPGLIEEINAFRPDILFIGLGMPVQERWIAEHHAALDVAVTTTCGATMTYITGAGFRPPAWTGSLGLYGIARMIADPKRLWKRYLLEPLLLAPYVAGAVLRLRFGRSRSSVSP